MSTPPLYTLGPDDELNYLMVYTRQGAIWGESIGKKSIRFLTLMRTPMCPAYIVLYNARLLSLGSSTPLAFPIMHIPITQALVVHPVPPHQEAYDFSPEEVNRKMVKVSTMLGDFRVDGEMRISTRTNVTQALDVAKEPYLALYNVRVTPLSARQKAINTRLAVVRRTDVALASYGDSPEPHPDLKRR